MIQLSRSELCALAEVFILANTPRSLFDAMVVHPVVARMKSGCERKELLLKYDEVTAKDRRSPFIIAFAYAILVALLTKPSSEISPEQPDVTRLLWGEHFVELANSMHGAVANVSFEMSSPVKDRRNTAASGPLIYISG